MFAVIGEWRMSPELHDRQQSGLQGIVAGVGRIPGFVSGWWTGSADGANSHTFVVFDDLAAAEAFASNARANLDHQREAGVENVALTVEAVTAHAPA